MKTKNDYPAISSWLALFLTHSVGFIVMAAAALPQPSMTKPKSMTRAKRWSDEVEEVYRFQLAGYRDRHDYAARNGEIGVGILFNTFPTA